jgi:preprotein translocase subunit SecD
MTAGIVAVGARSPAVRMSLRIATSRSHVIVFEPNPGTLPKGVSAEEAVAQDLEIIRSRLEVLGEVRRVGGRWCVVVVPGADAKTRESVKSLLRRDCAGFLQFRLVVESPTRHDAVDWVKDDSGKRYALAREQLLIGAVFKSIELLQGEYGDKVIDFQLRDRWVKPFADVTRRSIDRRLAIVYDGRVLAAPVIKSAITGGGSIGIRADQEELATVLGCGVLTASYDAVVEDDAPPSFGLDPVLRAKSVRRFLKSAEKGRGRDR